VPPIPALVPRLVGHKGQFSLQHVHLPGWVPSLEWLSCRYKLIRAGYQRCGAGLGAGWDGWPYGAGLAICVVR
jgi:hypothetical protein